jgi:hypothetical protein
MTCEAGYARSQMLPQPDGSFSTVKDPREGWRGLYPLHERLVLSASLAGMEDFVEIKLLGEQRPEVLRRFYPFERGVLSHGTLRI